MCVCHVQTMWHTNRDKGVDARNGGWNEGISREEWDWWGLTLVELGDDW